MSKRVNKESKGGSKRRKIQFNFCLKFSSSLLFLLFIFSLHLLFLWLSLSLSPLFLSLSLCFSLPLSLFFAFFISPSLSVSLLTPFYNPLFKCQKGLIKRALGKVNGGKEMFNLSSSPYLWLSFFFHSLCLSFLLYLFLCLSLGLFINLFYNLLSLNVRKS